MAKGNEKRRKDKELERYYRELGFFASILKDIDRLEEMSFSEIATFRAKLVKLIEFDKNIDGEAMKAMIETIDALVVVRQRMMNEIHGIVRQHKIESKRKREQPAQVVNLKCVRCNKRPRHFDDLCKRCANELGLRPTGKVT